MAGTHPTTTDLFAEGCLSVRETAELLSLSRGKVYGAIWSGQIPHVRLGGAVRIPRRALREYLLRNFHGVAGEEAGA